MSEREINDVRVRDEREVKWRGVGGKETNQN